MIRGINIVLIAAILSHTVGCSTWKPLARTNEASEDDRQTYMREQVKERLKEGMTVRITIREGTPAPIRGQVIECIIEEIGQESLTLIPLTDHIRGTVKREFALRFADIVDIENREFNHGLTNATIGMAAGAMLGLVLFAIGLSGLE